jgi:hypothetical protein
MQLATVQPAKTQSNPAISTGEKSRKPQLYAQWYVIDGQPTCRWILEDVRWAVSCRTQPGGNLPVDAPLPTA